MLRTSRKLPEGLVGLALQESEMKFLTNKDVVFWVTFSAFLLAVIAPNGSTTQHVSLFVFGVNTALLIISAVLRG